MGSLKLRQKTMRKSKPNSMKENGGTAPIEKARAARHKAEVPHP